MIIYFIVCTLYKQTNFLTCIRVICDSTLGGGYSRCHFVISLTYKFCV